MKNLEKINTYTNIFQTLCIIIAGIAGYIFYERIYLDESVKKAELLDLQKKFQL